MHETTRYRIEIVLMALLLAAMVPMVSADDYVPTWSRDVAEIDASRPVVLSMYNGGTGAGRSTPYGDHSVACIGYMDSTPQLLKIYDT